MGELVISRKSCCFDTHKTKWYRAIKRDYKAQQQLRVQLYLGVRSRIILEKDLWTSKGFVSAHKMIINIVSDVRCKPLQDMPAVVSFAFDNLQNRAYLFITNSVILHFAIWISLMAWLSLPDSGSRSPIFLSGEFSSVFSICLKLSSQLILFFTSAVCVFNEDSQYSTFSLFRTLSKFFYNGDWFLSKKLGTGLSCYCWFIW